MKQQNRQDLEKKIKRLEGQFTKFKKKLQDFIKTRHIEARSIWIRDENRAVRVGLAAYNGRAIIEICGGDPGEERVRASLFLLPDGTCGVAIFDKMERKRLELAVLPDGTPSIKCYDIKRNIVFKMPIIIEPERGESQKRNND